MTANLVIQGLKAAYKANWPEPGLIHYSVRGGQYTSWSPGKEAEAQQEIYWYLVLFYKRKWIHRYLNDMSPRSIEHV